MDSIETPYDKVDSNNVLNLCIALMQREEQVYGPVYGRMAKKNAIQFVTKKLGENPPEGFDEWNWLQLKDYLEKRLERYPYIFNALMYAGGKLEATLQGGTGSTQRIASREAAKQLDASQLGEALDFAQAWKQTVDQLVFFKVMPPGASYEIVDEDTIKFTVGDCPFKDVCDALHEENITRLDGDHICPIIQTVSSRVGQKIGAGCDYVLDEFKNPNCTVRLVKVL